MISKIPKKICLAIETTGTHLGVGLYAFDAGGGLKRRAASFSVHAGRQAESLFPKLDAALRRAALSKDDLDLIAVDVGPGSFTGVRIGVSAGRALAQALRVPIVGVNSLEALAWPASARAAPGSRFLVRLPALAGETYYAVYSAGGAEGLQAVQEPTWGTDADADGVQKKIRGFSSVSAARPPHPDSIAEIAVRRFLAAPRARFPYDAVVPLYLQPSWAERRK